MNLNLNEKYVPYLFINPTVFCFGRTKTDMLLIRLLIPFTENTFNPK